MISIEDAIEIFRANDRIIPIQVDTRDDIANAYNEENKEAIVIALACMEKVNEINKAIKGAAK